MDNTQEIIDLARRDVAARKAGKPKQTGQPWLWAFAGLAVTLLAGVFLLPIRGLDYRLQMVVHGVCAQAHFLEFGPLRMPLCARNTGIYAGFLGTFLFVAARRRLRAAILPPLPITLLLLLGAIAMVVDGVNSFLLDIGGYNIYGPRNELRVITGLLMGNALGIFVPYLVNLALNATPEAGKRYLGSWIEYIAVLLLNALIYLLIFAGPSWVFYPLSIFSVLGIVGVLFGANLFVLSMLGGLESRVRRLQQLARPATWALVLVAVELGLLAWLRMGMEHAAM